MKKISLLSPFLLALAGLLLLYAEASFEVSPDQILIPLVLVWLVGALLIFPVHCLLHDWDLTGICAGLFVIVLFFSPAAFKPAAVGVLAVFVAWAGLSLISKGPGKMRFLAVLFTFTSTLLAIFPMVVVGRLFLELPLSAYRAPVAGGPEIGPSASAQKPDIYYIVLDGYGRDDILRDYYSFDNSEFTGYLKSKGFILPEQARSNYAKTVLSVASALNMDYVQNIAPDLTDSPFWWLLTPYIRHSRLRSVLEQEGYQTYAVATDWDITDNRTVDHYYAPYPVLLNDFEGFFLNTAPIGRLQSLAGPFASIRSYQAHRAFIENNFAALRKMPGLAGPKFIFVHILAPHPPFVFDAGGNALDPAYTFSFDDANDFAGGRGQYRNQYVGQVKFVNARLKAVIDEILLNSTTPPILVLQADHGPGMATDFRSAAHTCMRERFSTFAAYYFPEADASLIPPDITAVNVFRMVLDQYFHADLPLLENTNYYYDDPAHIFRPKDVTAYVDQSCAAQDLP